MSAIDWSKAPNSAVAVLTTKPDNIHHPSTSFVTEFFRLGCTIRATGCDGRRLCALNDCWELIERPAAAWNGKGLPPVGTVCEIKRVPHGSWGEATVRFSSDNVIVWDWSDEPVVNGKCCSYAHEVECRPIRTPEQIAEVAKQEAIAQLIADTGGELGPSGAALLYSLGYRKQVAP